MKKVRIKSPKTQLLNQLKEAANELKLHKAGKLKLKTAYELLDEL